MKRIILIYLLFAGMVLLAGCSKTVQVKAEDFEKMTADQAELSAQNDYLKRDLAMAKEQLAAALDERDKLQKAFSQISNDNVNLKNTADSTKTQLGQQIDSLKNTISGNNDKMKTLESQISGKDMDIKTLKDQIKGLSTEQAKMLAEKEKEISNMNLANSNIVEAMQEEIKSGDLKIQRLGDTLSINFMDKIFFDSGSADIRNSGKAVLNKLVAILKTVKGKQIRVEGSTDNVPIAERYRWKFPSNWELSTARATTIVRYLQSQGIDPALLKATGYGEYNPIASNDTEGGRAQNRRIEIQLVPLDIRARYP